LRTIRRIVGRVERRVKRVHLVSRGVVVVRSERSIVRVFVSILLWIHRIVGRVGRRVQRIARVLAVCVRGRPVQRIARWHVRADVSSHRATQRIVGAVEKLVVWGSVVCGACAKDAHAIPPNVAGMTVWICKAMECIVGPVGSLVCRASCAKKAVVFVWRGWKPAQAVVRISRRIRKTVGRVGRLVRRVSFAREGGVFRLAPMRHQRCV
jgi:hypothetical protein